MINYMRDVKQKKGGKKFKSWLRKDKNNPVILKMYGVYNTHEDSIVMFYRIIKWKIPEKDN